MRQDIAVAVAEDVAAGELVAAAREAAGPELREIRVFDVYRGEQVGEGRKSVAFSVAYQSTERTLSEEDATAIRAAIVAALAAGSAPSCASSRRQLARRACLTRPAFSPPAAWMSAWWSSSEFSSAPKRIDHAV